MNGKYQNPLMSKCQEYNKTSFELQNSLQFVIQHFTKSFLSLLFVYSRHEVCCACRRRFVLWKIIKSKKRNSIKNASHVFEFI